MPLEKDAPGEEGAVSRVLSSHVLWHSYTLWKTEFFLSANAKNLLQNSSPDSTIKKAANN